MKTVVVTAYDVDPYKGSESGMGWNFIYQISKHNKILAITRKNNREHIEQYIDSYNIDASNIVFYYYDLPIWMRFWKKGKRGSSVYFYLWQLFMPIFIKKNQLYFDFAHNLNFHCDWVPTMLWVFGKELIWGPIGHHPKIPRRYILSIYGVRAYIKDRFVWYLKKIFWSCDIFLRVSKSRATTILCMNSSVNKMLRAEKGKCIIFPFVGSEKPTINSEKEINKIFRVLSVGRFVPIKGFDVVIEGFAAFWKTLNKEERDNVKLVLVGKGPLEQKLRTLCQKLGIDQAINFINWIERDGLAEIYASSSLFFFGSHEGAGMVVAEALSYGLPVICFDNYGPGEFVDHTCGVKIPYSTYNQSISQFSYELNSLYRNQNRRQTLAFGAINKFSNTFDWNTKGFLLKRIYENTTFKDNMVVA